MARIRRLRHRPDFLAAAAGRRFHTERMTAQGRLREPDEMRDGAAAEGLHVGFTITKRVGHATERNRIRRRLRGVLAALADEAPDAPADVVLIARRPALAAPFSTLVDDLRRALGTVTRRKPATRGANDTPPRKNGTGDDAASGAPAQTGAHDPRRNNPGGRSGRGRGKGSDRRSQKSTAHGTTDG